MRLSEAQEIKAESQMAESLVECRTTLANVRKTDASAADALDDRVEELSARIERLQTSDGEEWNALHSEVEAILDDLGGGCRNAVP